MKYSIFFIGLFVLLLSATLTAQTPSFRWVQSAGGTNSDYGQSIAVDASGNSYVTGYFYSPTITFGTTTLTNASSGTADMFVVKYDASGNVVWAKSAGGTSMDFGNSIARRRIWEQLCDGVFCQPDHHLWYDHINQRQLGL